MTTRRNIINKIIASLEPIYGLREAKSIADMVVESLMGWSKIDFLFDADTAIDLTADQHERLNNALKQLTHSRPVQYVLGESEFCGLKFTVREGVLIPRPETEELVGWIAAEHKCVEVLDIGTGSGAIAVALSHRLGHTSSMSAIDISDEALVIATQNARMNGVEVEFAKIDILSAPESWLATNRYDIIVSNPPYIPISDKVSMRDNVLNYEPHIALFVEDNDPLLFYRTIAECARKMLKLNGWLYFEIYEHLGHDLTQILIQQGYTNIELRSDINEKPRMIRCQKSFQ